MEGNMRKRVFACYIFILFGLFLDLSIAKGFGINGDSLFLPSPPVFLNNTSNWADSVLKQLTLAEKVGQMMMVACYPKKGKEDRNRITKLIQKYNIGGIIFFQGSPNDVAELAAYYQSISKTPLIYAIDGEWGLSMRLEKTIVYPRQMMLGAITNDTLIYQMGRDIGKQLKMLGIHINFAPVVDINNNPENPVINSRSFGELRDNVVHKGILYMKGLQDEGIIAVAKHFPGHGDTDVDSHYGLPVIKHSLERLDSMELYPFRALIGCGVGGVLMAHMNVPILDTTPNLPSSLSALIIDSLLKKQLNFKGLVFTDAMGMKGVADLYPPEEANYMAVKAGNDIVLMPDEVEKSIDKLLKMVENCEIDTFDIDVSCTKILQAKKWSVIDGLKENKMPAVNLNSKLNSSGFKLTQSKLIEQSITIAKDKEGIIPIIHLDTCRIALLSLGGNPGNEYQQTVQKYANVETFHFKGTEETGAFMKVFDSLQTYNLVLLSLHSSEFRAQKQFGVSDRLLEWTNAIMNRYPVLLNVFTNPYLLQKFQFLDNSRAVVVSYENDSLTQCISAEMLFGAFGAKGKLPVSIDSVYFAGTGIESQGGTRIKYTSPLEAGFDELKLKSIDSLVEDAISKRAMPGCQVLAARNGMVFFQKSYGYQTYRKIHPIDNNDLYDLASVTKICSTIPSLMLLDQNGIIDINQPLSSYLHELDSTNKSGMLIKDILLHQGGLKAWIPFSLSYLEPIYPEQTLSKSKYSEDFPIQVGSNYYLNKQYQYKDSCFSHYQSPQYSVEVAECLFMNAALKDSIYKTIYESELDKPGTYRYSDIGFYLFQKMIENKVQKDLSKFADSSFYIPLGATSLGYLPLKRFNKDMIAPTENDLVFRRQIIQGYVHDPGAAMLGGIAGHAGLFSNSNDLAKYMQMLLNGGTYGGHNFFEKEIVRKYTSCQECDKGNRRGLGFDKPEPDSKKNGPVFKGISTDSYGHSGFTGTMVWADPSTGILFIFLSNRVFPDANCNKLLEMNVRTNIQKAIYDARLDQ
jgi:beta-N-acetylhexosaminidase